MAVVCGVCAILVTAAAHMGSDRPSSEFMATAPRSSLEADYSVDAGAPRVAPLMPEIVEEATRDYVALGLSAPETTLNAGLGVQTESKPAAPARAGESSESSAVSPGAAAMVEPPVATVPASASFPLAPLAIALLVVGAGIWVAYYLLRPKTD